MRFKEFLNEQLSRDEIFDIAKEMFGIRNWELQSFRVLMNRQVEILDSISLESKTVKELPFTIMPITKPDISFKVNAPLISFKGLPTQVSETFTLGPKCRACKSFDHLPKKVGKDFYMEYAPADKSLIGFSNAVEELHGDLIMDFDRIKKGGLELLNIRGLRGLYSLEGTGASSLSKDLSEPFKIIKKYLGRPHDIFECQEELINAGYEAYTEL